MSEKALQQIRREIIQIVSAVMTVIAVQQVGSPDAMRTLKMRVARRVQTLSYRGALKCLDLNEYAHKVYEKECA